MPTEYVFRGSCMLQLASSPGILSAMRLEEVLVSLLRQERHQFIIGPEGG